MNSAITLQGTSSMEIEIFRLDSADLRTGYFETVLGWKHAEVACVTMKRESKSLRDKILIEYYLTTSDGTRKLNIPEF